MALTRVRIDDIHLNAYDEGSGPVVLFVHGFPLSHAMWRGQFSLADRYRVIAPDLSGFGVSDVVPGKMTMERFADDLILMLDALGVREPIVLCGLSMGGYVAWQFVRRHATRLRGLILCDTRAAADSPEAAEQRHKMAEHVLKCGTSGVAEAMPLKLFSKSSLEHRPEIIADVRKMIERTNPAGLAAAQLGMAERDDVRAILPSITVPTLVVVGREDPISPVDEMRGIAEAIPGAKFEIIEDAGHMAPLERPETFNLLLSTFIDDL